MTRPDYHDIIYRFIYEYYCKHDKDPEKWEIEEALGLTPKVINLNFPEYKGQLSLIEKQVSELDDLTNSEISEKLGLSYQTVAGIRHRIKVKGGETVRIRKNTRDKIEHTYIRVKKAKVENNKTLLDLTGCGGYIETTGGRDKFYIYKDCKRYTVDLKENQYEVVG